MSCLLHEGILSDGTYFFVGELTSQCDTHKTLSSENKHLYKAPKNPLLVGWRDLHCDGLQEQLARSSEVPGRGTQKRTEETEGECCGLRRVATTVTVKTSACDQGTARLGT